MSRAASLLWYLWNHFFSVLSKATFCGCVVPILVHHQSAGTSEFVAYCIGLHCLSTESAMSREILDKYSRSNNGRNTILTVAHLCSTHR